MSKKTRARIKSDGGPIFLGKVNNRNGQITGRIEKQSQNKRKGRSIPIPIAVAIIGALATIIAAVLQLLWNR